MKPLRVTVTELPDERQTFADAWAALRKHVAEAKSDWVVLPEMPFDAWFAARPAYEAERWKKAVRLHQEAEWTLLPSLAPARVFYTKPVDDGAGRYNAAAIFEGGKAREAHRKVYLPNEEPVFEAAWYQRGEGFAPSVVDGVSTGALVCTELWFFEAARRYGRNGVDALWSPRKTDGTTLEKWLLAGRAAAICAGAYSFSANSRSNEGGLGFGGGGWIVDPEGEVIARTSAAEPFVTAAVDFRRAAEAKQTYPRNVAG